MRRRLYRAWSDGADAFEGAGLFDLKSRHENPKNAKPVVSDTGSPDYPFMSIVLIGISRIGYGL
jgi:hypothetical protein